ncbi:MAG TPA: hypothetical protein VMZ28_22865 [Kofleriaceae bacterium]|nr:hypothetical protein [Kofleriaceae bacterium]
MRTSTRLELLVLATSLLAAGCSGDDDGGSSVLDDFDEGEIADADDMDIWATASAPNVFISAYLPITLADLAREDGDCPAMTEDDTTVTYEGDCTDADGRTWIGRATTIGDMTSETASVSYEGFGFRSQEDCDGDSVPSELAWSGGIVLSSTGSALSAEIDVTADGSNPGADCEPFPTQLGIDYDLTMDDEGEANRWNGSGRVGNSLYGRVEASTEEEVVDGSVCNSEALSGTTVVTAGDDVAVVTYDGADDCDEDSTVTWTLNGDDQGELAGVSCAAGGGTGGGGALALLAALMVVVRRRRAVTPR